MRHFSARTRLLAAVTVTLLILAAVPGTGARAEEIYPTCTQDGYLLFHQPDGTVQLHRNRPAAGHSFGPWELDPALGTGLHTCQVCGTWERVDLKAEGIPALFLTGDLSGIGPDAPARVRAELYGLDRTDDAFSCGAFLSLLASSGENAKKSYVLSLFRDSDGKRPFEYAFSGWPVAYRYVLSARAEDPSAVRGMIGAALWREMAASRAETPERLQMLPLRGVPDGFPVTVWLNDVFLGLYTLELPKDERLYGMYRGERAAAVSAGAADPDSGTVFCASEDRQWIAGALQQLDDAAAQSGDAAFDAAVSGCLDVEGAVDYLLLRWTLGLNGADGGLLLTYGNQWTPVPDGMENGLQGAYAAGLPEAAGEGLSADTGSALWDRLTARQAGRLKERYLALRETVLSEVHIVALIEEMTGSIPAAAYAMDEMMNPVRLSAQEDKAQMLLWVHERLALMDAVLGGM